MSDYPAHPRRRDHRSLRVRIEAVLVLLTVLFGAVALATVLADRSRSTARVEVTASLRPARVGVEQLLAAMVDQETGERGYALAGDPVFLQPYTAGAADAARLFVSLPRLLVGQPESLAALELVRAAAAAWQRTAAVEIAKVGADQRLPTQALADALQEKTIFDELRSKVNRLGDSVAAALDRAERRQAVTDRGLGRVVVAAFVVVVVFAVAVFVLLRRWLARPLAQVVTDISAVAGGDLEHRVTSRGLAEFQSLSGATEKMRLRLVGEARTARALAEANSRLAWLEAATGLTTDLLSADAGSPLQLVAETVTELAGADLAVVELPTSDPDQLIVEAAVGAAGSAMLANLVPTRHSVAGHVMRTGIAQRVADIRDDPQAEIYQAGQGDIGPTVVVPLLGSGGVRGVLVVARGVGRPAFTDTEVQLATMFAGHAAVALELADAQLAQRRVLLLEQRDRIARDLHDHVIQRLYGEGLRTQAIAGAAAGGAAGIDIAERLTAQTDTIDDIIRQIRSTIFDLIGPLSPVTSDLRNQITVVADELTDQLGFRPILSFHGPIDTMVCDAVAVDLVAISREALTNVLRHAHATTASLRLSVAGNTVALDVNDNGVGMGATTRRSGLANLGARAKQHAGTLDVVAHAGPGTHLHVAMTADDETQRASELAEL